jgi:hypothetical protein
VRLRWWKRRNRQAVNFMLLALAKIATYRPKIGLRTALVLVSLLSIICASAKVWHDRSESQRQVLEALQREGWRFRFPAQRSWVETAFGRFLPRDYFVGPEGAVKGKDLQISQREVELIAQLPTLQTLGILPWKLNADISLTPLCNLQRLQVLRLDGLRISTSDVEAIAACRELRYLSIHGGSMAIEQIDRVAQITTLKDAGFGNVGVSREEITRAFHEAGNPRFSFTPGFLEELRLLEQTGRSSP